MQTEGCQNGFDFEVGQAPRRGAREPKLALFVGVHRVELELEPLQRPVEELGELGPCEARVAGGAGLAAGGKGEDRGLLVEPSLGPEEVGVGPKHLGIPVGRREVHDHLGPLAHAKGPASQHQRPSGDDPARDRGHRVEAQGLLDERAKKVRVRAGAVLVTRAGAQPAQRKRQRGGRGLRGRDGHERGLPGVLWKEPRCAEQREGLVPVGQLRGGPGARGAVDAHLDGAGEPREQAGQPGHERGAGCGVEVRRQKRPQRGLPQQGDQVGAGVLGGTLQERSERRRARARGARHGHGVKEALVKQPPLCAVIGAVEAEHAPRPHEGLGGRPDRGRGPQPPGPALQRLRDIGVPAEHHEHRERQREQRNGASKRKRWRPAVGRVPPPHKKVKASRGPGLGDRRQ
jgi:hypothetical protein